MKKVDSESWGATPPLRKLWSSSRGLLPGQQQALLEVELSGYSAVAEIDVREEDDEETAAAAAAAAEAAAHGSRGEASSGFMGLSTIPGIVIGVILNLFLSISFGSAFYPSQWEFPATVSRSLGMQQFLLSTIIAQIVMTFTSSFPCAVGMHMVENLPFSAQISLLAIQKQGMASEDAFATVLMANVLMSLLVGACFLACGHFKLGNLLNVIPKSLVLGCIGGIGVFIFKTGVEVSINAPFSLAAVSAGWRHVGLSLLFELILRGIQFAIRSGPLVAIIPPLYFCSIPPVFYAALWALQVPLAQAHSAGYFFPSDTGEAAADFTAPVRLLVLSKVSWEVILQSLPTMLASTAFAFLHVPLNVPALKLTSGYDADINMELTSHGYANLAAALLGQPQSYLCYSNSILFHRCGGKGRFACLLLALISLACYFSGPGIIAVVPRCMPGCLLLHIGVDLAREALVDSLLGGSFDHLEYVIIAALTVVMTVWGMTEGLILGIVAACVTFIFQVGALPCLAFLALPCFALLCLALA